MKKIIVGLFFTCLIFAACSRKSSDSATTPSQTDTTDTPPSPPGNSGDSSNVQNSDTTNNPVAAKFSFLPQKPVLETENIGIICKKDNANILTILVNICGGNNVVGVAFDFDYDSSKLVLKSVTKGDFLGSDGNQVDFYCNGSIIGISRLGQGVGGISGSGTICSIELEARNQFVSSFIGFKNQSATNLDSSNWFGGIVGYK